MLFENESTASHHELFTNSCDRIYFILAKILPTYVHIIFILCPIYNVSIITFLEVNVELKDNVFAITYNDMLKINNLQKILKLVM